MLSINKILGCCQLRCEKPNGSDIEHESTYVEGLILYKFELNLIFLHSQSFIHYIYLSIN